MTRDATGLHSKLLAKFLHAKGQFYMFWNHCCSGILTKVECLIGSEASGTGNKPLMRDLLPIFGIAGHLEADSTLSFCSLL